METIGEQLTSMVLSRILRNLGAHHEATAGHADERVASALKVPVADVRAWSGDCRLVPLDYRLVLGIWLEGLGRQRDIAAFRDLGRELRVVAQRERAAHMVEAALLFADAPAAERADRVMAHTEARCRRSPPPTPPTVDDAMRDVMLSRLLANDEGDFVVARRVETPSTTRATS
jgi:hypothetical protein